MISQTCVDSFNVPFNICFKRFFVVLYPFPKPFITQLDHFKKYINCSLIKLKCYINDLTPISSTLASHSSNIQSLTTFVTELPDLIKKVLSNLQSAIKLNITLLCFKISAIVKSIKCFNKEIHKTMDIINCIIRLICKCNNGIKCLQKCLKEIRCKLQKLYLELHEINVKIWRINSLRVETQEILKCNKDTYTLKFRINELVERYKCSIREFKCIESQIKSMESIIKKLKELKQKLCKQFDNIRLIMCITNSTDKVNIVIINASSVKKKIESLTEKIDKICSELGKIEETTTDLKHSLMFNSYYLQISSYILEHLECIQSNTQLINPKTSDLNGVQSHVKVISDNIKDIRPVIEKMNQHRDDLGYIRESLCSIIPKMCQIKASAKQITSKSTELQCVVQSLHKIKSSIEKLKELECEQKCLKIIECEDGRLLKYTLICIRDQLEINYITDKLEKVKKSISSLESVICNTNKLLGYIETIENILSVIQYFINIYTSYNYKLLYLTIVIIRKSQILMFVMCNCLIIISKIIRLINIGCLVTFNIRTGNEA